MSAYSDGAGIDGWICHHCQKEFRHEGTPRRVYVGLVIHKIVRHRRLPRGRPSIVTVTIYETPEWTERVYRETP